MVEQPYKIPILYFRIRSKQPIYIEISSATKLNPPASVLIYKSRLLVFVLHRLSMAVVSSQLKPLLHVRCLALADGAIYCLISGEIRSFFS
jgi:hypothetical protein